MFKRAKDAFEVQHDRFYYEPRVFWTVQSLTSGEETALGNNGRVRVPDPHFYNPSRFPIRLTHMIVSPIGYLFRSFTSAPPLTLTNFDNAGAAVIRTRVRISAPETAYWQPYDMRLFEFAAVPASDSPGTSLDVNRTYASSILGVSRWDFDVPYFVPKRGTIQFDLSVAPRSDGIIGGAELYTAVVVTERAGRRLANFRTRERAQLAYGSVAASGPGLFYPQNGLAVPCDQFGVQAVGAASQPFWQSAGLFPGSTYDRQEGNRGLDYNQVVSYSVLVDQIDHDDDVDASIAGSNPISSMATRIGTRARTRNGGTQEWWWRDGAPLALVCPTMTPGLVKKLEDPIWLGPGEQLMVEMEAPDPITVDGETVAPTYNVGLSLCGYAVVEDNRAKR